MTPTLPPGSLLASRLLGSPVSSHPVGPGRVGYKLGHPGRPSRMPTLLITLFDNSGSVTSPGGTDPLSNRYAEVTRAFSAVARKGARHELGAIVHFDTPSSGEIEPTPITRRGLIQLRAGLRPPQDGAGTSELGPSLERAYQMAEASPDHEISLIVLSDFALMDPDLAQVMARLAAFPGTVHAVVLGSRLSADVFDPRIISTPIGRDSAPGAVARALFSSLVTHRPGAHVVEET
ncbi:MAG TPA: vWA domain-containing protein [Streptosporangiaceae bacterium]|nr:vWA domain-containing protein [Streptosporangiaceae bacterium]